MIRLFLSPLLALLLAYPAHSQSSRQDSLLRLARSEGADSSRADALNQLANSYMSSSPDSMNLFAREALPLTRRMRDTVLHARTLQKVAIASQLLGKLDSALHYFTQAQSLFHQKGYTKGYIEASINLANTHFSLGNYLESESLILKALEKIRKNDRWGQYRIPSLLLLSNIYQLTDQNTKAADRLREVLQLAESSPRYAGKLPYIANNLASLYLDKLAQPDSALKILDAELQKDRAQKTPDAFIDLLINRGDISAKHLQNWQEARLWYQKAREVAEEKGFRIRMPMIMGRLAENDLELGKIDRAQKLIRESIVISKEIGEVEALKSVYKRAIRVDSASGDVAQALHHLRTLHALEDSLLGAEKQLALRDLEQQIEISEREHTIDILEQEKAFETRLKRLWAFGLVILLLLASGLIWYQFRMIRRKKELAAKEKELRHSQEQLMHAALEREKVGKEMIQKELDFKSQRLQDLATLLNTKKELFREITDQLKKLNQGPAHDSLKAVLQQLQPHLQLDRDLKELDLYMEKDSQTFLMSLEERYPSLTKNDKKLSALIRMGMSNREIGILLNINTKSAEMGRYRLRKKLSLDPEVDLQLFLKDLDT